MEKPSAQTCALSALTVCVGGILGLAWPSDAATAMRPESVQDQLCTGGMPGPLSAELLPKKIISAQGKDHLVASLRVNHKFPSAPKARLAIELLNDRHESVKPAEILDVVLADKSGSEVSLPETPDLPDGFYALRATIVAKSGSQVAAEAYTQHFSVSAHRVLPLSQEEWNTQSQVNLETRRPPVMPLVPATAPEVRR